MKLSSHHSATITKLLLIGESGTGKTGSLVSLVQDGYKLRVLDLDNGLDSLVAFIHKLCPERIDQVEYETLRDRYKATPGGPVIDGHPHAFVDSLKLLTKWSDGTSPADWGPDYVMVIDTMTALGRAAFDWAKGMNPTAKDPRNWYFVAQQAVENVIAMITSEGFKSNVVVTSHIQYKEMDDGTTKGFATAIGSALGPHIPKYFNTILQAKTNGPGKRIITPLPSGLVDLKTPVPFKLDKPLDVGIALSYVFKTLKES